MIDVITDNTKVPKVTMTINSKWFSGSVTILDLSWYAPYSELGDNIICIFAYSAFLWRLFVSLPGIINGGSAMIHAVNTDNEIIDLREKRK